MIARLRLPTLTGLGLAPRLLEGVLWLAAVGLATWWGLRLLGTTPLPAPPTLAAAPPEVSVAPQALLDSVTLFGARKPGATSDNLVPLGMIADGTGRGSVLISVDGQPAKRYRVGDEIEGRRITAIRKGEIEYIVNGERRTVRTAPRNLPVDGVVRHGGAAMAR